MKALKAAKDSTKNLATDDCLDTLGIAPAWDRIRGYVAFKSDEFRVKPDQAERTFGLAKKLRTIRAHRFGEPPADLLELLQKQSFADYNLRLLDGELEVTLVFSRNVIEVIHLKATAMNSMAEKLYHVAPVTT